jgi:hypothetical protein
LGSFLMAGYRKSSAAQAIPPAVNFWATTLRHFTRASYLDIRCSVFGIAKHREQSTGGVWGVGADDLWYPTMRRPPYPAPLPSELTSARPKRDPANED